MWRMSKGLGWSDNNEGFDAVIQDKCLTMSNSRTTRTSGPVEVVGWKCPDRNGFDHGPLQAFSMEHPHHSHIWLKTGRTAANPTPPQKKHQPSFAQLEVFLKGVISVIHVHFNGLSYLSGCINWNVRPWHWLAWTEWSGSWCSRGCQQWPRKPRLRQHRPAHGNWWGGQGHSWQHWRRHAPHGGSHQSGAMNSMDGRAAGCYTMQHRRSVARHWWRCHDRRHGHRVVSWTMQPLSPTISVATIAS